MNDYFLSTERCDEISVCTAKEFRMDPSSLFHDRNKSQEFKFAILHTLSNFSTSSIKDKIFQIDKLKRYYLIILPCTLTEAVKCVLFIGAVLYHHNSSDDFLISILCLGRAMTFLLKLR